MAPPGQQSWEQGICVGFLASELQKNISITYHNEVYHIYHYVATLGKQLWCFIMVHYGTLWFIMVRFCYTNTSKLSRNIDSLCFHTVHQKVGDLVSELPWCTVILFCGCPGKQLWYTMELTDQPWLPSRFLEGVGVWGRGKYPIDSNEFLYKPYNQPRKSFLPLPLPPSPNVSCTTPPHISTRPLLTPQGNSLPYNSLQFPTIPYNSYIVFYQNYSSIQNYDSNWGVVLQYYEPRRLLLPHGQMASSATALEPLVQMQTTHGRWVMGYGLS